MSSFPGKVLVWCKAFAPYRSVLPASPALTSSELLPASPWLLPDQDSSYLINLAACFKTYLRVAKVISQEQLEMTLKVFLYSRGRTSFTDKSRHKASDTCVKSSSLLLL